MSIKGFSTQKKLETSISGFTDKQVIDTAQFATAQKTSSNKILLDTTSNVVFRLHPAVKTVEANSTKRIIKITAHGALPGDLLRFEETAQNPFFESGIISTPDANTIVLAAELDVAPNTGDEFYLLRNAQMRTDETGALIVSVAAAPISFVLDGVDTEVEEDTATPANSIPLPTKVLDSSGVEIDFATQTTLASVDSKLTDDGAGNLQVNLKTEIPAGTQTIGKVDVNSYTSGSVVNGTLSTTSANTEAAPANAVGFIVQNESSNSNPIRFRVGGTASTSAGVLLEAGRDSGYIPIAATVSLCNTVSSTQIYSILWVIK